MASLFFLAALLVTLVRAGSGNQEPESIDFARDVRPILQRRCYECHGETKQKGDLRLDVRSEAFSGGTSFGPSIVPGNPDDSPLYQFIASDSADLVMPPEGEMLSAEEVDMVRRWIEQGAVWPADADLVVLEDRRDHWSFKPLQVVHPPQHQLMAVDSGDQVDRFSSFRRSAIDDFILDKLLAAQLGPAPEADRPTWLRRVTLDLTGLPPTAAEMADFLSDDSPHAYEKVVDRLLATHHFGERWGQHWLDVVRYADTDGFEVNTPRPNAWPYRDYVIAAINLDTPYDQFIREQLAGDQLGKDAATGFLVTAAALLPGQIGQDDISKRIARQDELSEVIVNTGEVLLGLSIACARCHDHKFDAIPQRDYYALQAFFAGVRYGERENRGEDYELRKQRRQVLETELSSIDRQLEGLSPLARPNKITPVSTVEAATAEAHIADSSRPPINARRNLDRFVPVLAERLRFTILSTNNLEPCIDELEVFNDAGVNVALAASGTRVYSSGNAPISDHHKLEHVNDGLYGNSKSWMSSETGRGWVELVFAEPQRIDRVIWGRDRLGQYSDRLAIQYRIEALVPDNTKGTASYWQVLADASDRAPIGDPAVSVGIAEWLAQNSQNSDLRERLDRRQVILSELEPLRTSEQVFAGQFVTPEETFVLLRGDTEQPGASVAPAVLSALGEMQLPASSDDATRRLMLADWITSPSNPLTARVIANRVWQWHFGRGLVDTPSDFGRSGSKPSHPELLDWLASCLIRSGWSLKKLHREIVLSATYRQSSQINAQALAVDADVRLLWRFPQRRLEAEAIRDAILATSGRMIWDVGGAGFDLFQSRGGLNGFPPIESFTAPGLRRMVYAHKIRMERDAVFGAFDCPDAGQSTARRRQSTTPIQALNLFNSQFTFDESLAFAQRIQLEAGNDVGAQISCAFRIAFCREPTEIELSAIRPLVVEHGLESLCRAIFNSNEFLFIP
jgi:hypothetical protein